MCKLKSLILLVCLLLSGAFASAADIVYTEPAIIQQSSTGIVVYFRANEGTGGLAGLTSGVYAHTGVITSLSTSSSDWKHAPSKWGDNSAKYAMTYVSSNLWKLDIGDLKTYYGLAEGETVTKMAFVFRNADGTKEGKATGGGDIFIDVHEDGLAVNLTSDASASVLTDANSTVNLTATASLASDLSLYVNSTSTTPIATASATTTLTKSYTVPTGDCDIIAKAVSGTTEVYDTISFCHRGTSQAVAYSGTLKQGATVNSDGSVTFCLYAPNKSNVILVGEWDNFRVKNTNLMNYQGDKYFWYTVPAGTLDMDKEYGYYFIVDDNLNIADPYCHQISDPWNDKYINQNYTIYPNLKAFPSKLANFDISVFHGNIDKYNWQVTNFSAPAKQNLNIYELLVRDFTPQQSIEAAMGKLDYLDSLGVNAIELMPISEFDGNNSWGYNPNFFMAPDKAYGTPDMYKKFIDECHKRGIAVIMDIVFNHSWGLNPWCLMYWDSANSRPAADSPFFNAVAPHNYSVGNDWKQESSMVRTYFADVLKYWTSTYKIDGFRFDLAKGYGDSNSYSSNVEGSSYNSSRIANIKRFADAIHSVNPNAYVILEYFVATAEENEMGNYGCMSWKKMNYAYCQSAMGWPTGSAFSGMYSGDESRPFGSTVGYMESHDETRMAYKQKNYGTSIVKASNPIRMRRLGSNAAFAFLVPGAHMIWEFGEMGYDLSEDEGSISTDPKTPHWEYLADANRKGLHDNYAEILGIRNGNPDLFDVPNGAEFYWSVTASNWDNGRFITARNTSTGKQLVAAYNPTSTDKTFTYTFDNPSGTYYINSSSYGVTTSFDAAAGTITVPRNSYVVITNMKNAGVDNVITDVKTSHKVSIYPNPTTDYIQVNSNDVKSLEVYSIMGAKVASVTGENILNVSNLATGNYIVRIATADGIFTEKLIKR